MPFLYWTDHFADMWYPPTVSCCGTLDASGSAVFFAAVTGFAALAVVLDPAAGAGGLGTLSRSTKVKYNLVLNLTFLSKKRKQIATHTIRFTFESTHPQVCPLPGWEEVP